MTNGLRAISISISMAGDLTYALTETMPELWDILTEWDGEVISASRGHHTASVEAFVREKIREGGVAKRIRF